ncbi:MAG: hypothetical protein WCG87_11300 [Bacteroidota bacterium]
MGWLTMFVKEFAYGNEIFRTNSGSRTKKPNGNRLPKKGTADDVDLCSLSEEDLRSKDFELFSLTNLDSYIDIESEYPTFSTYNIEYTQTSRYDDDILKTSKFTLMIKAILSQNQYKSLKNSIIDYYYFVNKYKQKGIKYVSPYYVAPEFTVTVFFNVDGEVFKCNENRAEMESFLLRIKKDDISVVLDLIWPLEIVLTVGFQNNVEETVTINKFFDKELDDFIYEEIIFVKCNSIPGLYVSKGVTFEENRYYFSLVDLIEFEAEFEIPLVISNENSSDFRSTDTLYDFECKFV